MKNKSKNQKKTPTDSSGKDAIVQQIMQRITHPEPSCKIEFCTKTRKLMPADDSKSSNEIYIDKKDSCIS